MPRSTFGGNDMKTKMRFSKQILSVLLCVAMLLSYAPVTAFAAEPGTPEYVASVYLEGKLRPAVFANGTDIMIEAGNTGGTTSVYYMSDGQKTPVVENADLSDAFVLAGYNNTNSSLDKNVTITMYGGNVNRIYAGHKGSGVIRGDVTVIMAENATVQGVLPSSGTGQTTVSGKLRSFAANGLSATTVAGRTFLPVRL